MRGRAVLFDLDGVLIDSTVCIVRHWSEWAQKHHLDVRDVMREAHGVRSIETMWRVAPHLDCAAEAEIFCKNEVQDTEGIVTIPGAAVVLSALPMDCWAIVTSCSRDLAKARLIKAGLPVPGVLVSADDVTHGKPSPEPYLAGAQRLGLSPEDCIVIEDAPAGVEAGKLAGMRVMGVAATHSPEQLLAKKADCVLRRLSDLRIRLDSNMIWLSGCDGNS